MYIYVHNLCISMASYAYTSRVDAVESSLPNQIHPMGFCGKKKGYFNDID